MEQFRICSYISSIDEDNDFEIKKIVKKRKINKKPNLIPFSKSFVDVINRKNIKKIENFCKTFNKTYKNDPIFELYNNKLLTTERLQFIMKDCTKYFSISSNLIKKLIKEEEISLLDIFLVI